jgi:hypothetical protein
MLGSDRRRRVLALASAAVLVTSCGGSAAPLTTSGIVDAPDFALTTDAFGAGGAIPARFTCDGADVSPALAWTRAPSRAGAYVLIVDDPDANGFVHWIAYNLPGGASGSLPEAVGTGAAGVPQGRNDFGKTGWGGPCPPSGEHRYRFTLSAIADALPITGSPSGREVREALGNALLLATTTLEGRYARP